MSTEYVTRDVVEHDHHVQDSHDIDTILKTAVEVKTMSPYCFPLNMDVNKQLLLQSWFELFNRLGYDYNTMVDMLREDFVEKYKQLGNPTDPIAWDMNISYMPGLENDDRWRKFRGTIDWIRDEGGDPRLASELLTELDGLYIGDLIKRILAYHKEDTGRDFKGQVNILFVGVGQRYNLHNDSNLHLRYHIPIITHPNAFWLFQDMTEHDKFYTMHMPFGEVWKLNPIDIVHTVVNKWDTPRAHLVLSEFKE